MDGIIIMDKPEDFTSFDMVAKLRRLLGTRKVGHAGTLDPMATGVLPIFVGRATKCCDILPDQNKRYTATFELGYTTDTLDATGRVLTRTPVQAGKAQVQAALEQFRGEIMQLPPMYSAIQINGRTTWHGRESRLSGKSVQSPSIIWSCWKQMSRKIAMSSTSPARRAPISAPSVPTSARCWAAGRP